MNKFNIANIDFIDRSILMTVIFFVAYLAIRYLAIAAMKKWSFNSNEDRRRSTATFKNGLLVVFIIGLIFIWGSEIRAFALSLVAVAAALVLATKEIILCLMGGILKASTKLFTIGDRIQIKGLRGEVTDHNFFVTVLFEIGPGEKSNQFTGRTLKIPNSVFLTDSTVVEPSGNHYCLTVFRVPLLIPKSIKVVEELILKNALIACKPFQDEAQSYILDICAKEGVEAPFLDPRVLYELKDKDTIEFHIRMPVPYNQKSKVEKLLLDLFFEDYEKVREKVVDSLDY